MELEQVQQLVVRYGPLAVGVGSTLDNTGVPIFFVAGLTVAAVLDVPTEAMFAAALAGSIAGDLAVYAIGRFFLTKDRLLMGGFGQRCGPLLQAGEKAMEKWGIVAIALGRFVPYVGKVTPFLAGSYQTSWLRVTVAVCAGSLLLLGFFYVFADSVITIVTGQASTVEKTSVAIGVTCLAGLWWANGVLNKRLKQSQTIVAKKSRYL